MRALVPEDLHRRAAVLRERALSTLTRSVITVSYAHFNPSQRAGTFARERWGEDEADSITTVLRATSAPATTSQAGWAQELAPITSAFLAALVPVSAGSDLLNRALALQFDGANKINVPGVTVPLADFVAQGASIPVIEGITSIEASLEPSKFATIVLLTREQIESSAAEPLVRQTLLDAVGPSLDRRLFDANAAVADLRPAGLLYGKTALTPSGETDKLAAMIADLSALGAAVAPRAGNGGIIFVAAAKQAVAINIAAPRELPYPLLASTSLGDGTVIAVAANAVVSAGGAVPQIDTTRTASVHMDDAPLAIADGGTMASPIISMFQTDVVGLRLRWPISWALRHADAIAFMDAVSWP